MKKTKVSVITASYNYQEYIKETIESVLSQSYPEWEMIIVDDGSTDNSVEVIKQYCAKDNRIKFYQHENGINKGLAQTVKLGIEKANTDWLIFLESDDTITPDYIEKKIKIIEQYPEIKFIYNDVNMFGDVNVENDFYSKYFKYLYDFWGKEQPQKCVNAFKKYNIVPTFSCVMLKKELLKNIDYNSKSPKHLDFYLWSQLAYNNDFYFIKEKLTNWRMSQNSYVRTPEDPYNEFYFYEVQIANNISGNKYKLFYLIKFFIKHFKYYKQKIIKIRLNKREKSIVLFGKKIY